MLYNRRNRIQRGDLLNGGTNNVRRIYKLSDLGSDELDSE